MTNNFKIGVFDSGYGGLTVLKDLLQELPQYSYIYLGDNARSPYGTRSYETVYKYTLEAVKKLFELDCYLIIIACNTASAKALRSIQQIDLPKLYPNRRILGVIRPTTESIDRFTKNNHIGILGTNGTVNSNSYKIEINKFFPEISVSQQACPMWVPLIENGEYDSEGSDYFVKKYIDEILEKDINIDTLILACTHYPLLLNKIGKYTPKNITIINQGQIVARSLSEYLVKHPEIETRLSKQSGVEYFTTDIPDNFDKMAQDFIGKEIKSTKIGL